MAVGGPGKPLVEPAPEPGSTGPRSPLGQVRRRQAVGESLQLRDGPRFDSIGKLDSPGRSLLRPPGMAAPRPPVGREHLEVVTPGRHQLARRDHGGASEVPDVEPFPVRRRVEPSLAGGGEARHIRRGEHRAGAGPAHHLGADGDRVAPADDEVAAEAAKRLAEIAKRVEQERQAIRGGIPAPDDVVVEHEQREHPFGRAGGRGQRRVIIDPQVAGEQQDCSVHERKSPKV